MSADNGFVIRKNVEGKFVLQEYCASADFYPDISEGVAFNTLELAAQAYAKTQAQYSEHGIPIEYGLNIYIDE